MPRGLACINQYSAHGPDAGARDDGGQMSNFQIDYVADSALRVDCSVLIRGRWSRVHLYNGRTRSVRKLIVLHATLLCVKQEHRELVD